MSNRSSPSLEKRAGELDTITAVLPIERRDKLAEILTDQDVETLRHLVNEGMGENTLRALTSDLAYLEAWSLAATGSPLPWPAPIRDFPNGEAEGALIRIHAGLEAPDDLIADLDAAFGRVRMMRSGKRAS